MPSFNRDELRGDALRRALEAEATHPKKQGGQGQSVGWEPRDKRRSAEETEKLIKSFLKSQKKPVPLMDICNHLERRPGPHLRRIMDMLIARGEVDQSEDYGAGPSIPRHLYRMAR